MFLYIIQSQELALLVAATLFGKYSTPKLSPLHLGLPDTPSLILDSELEL